MIFKNVCARTCVYSNAHAHTHMHECVTVGGCWLVMNDRLQTNRFVVVKHYFVSVAQVDLELKSHHIEPARSMKHNTTYMEAGYKGLTRGLDQTQEHIYASFHICHRIAHIWMRMQSLGQHCRECIYQISSSRTLKFAVQNRPYKLLGG